MRRLVLAALLAPLLALPVTLAGIALLEFVFGHGGLRPSALLAEGLVVSLYTMPTAYLVVAAVGVPWVAVASRRGRTIHAKEALMVGGATGIVAATCWIAALNAGHGHFLAGSAPAQLLPLGAAIGMAVGAAFHRLVESRPPGA